MDSIVRRPLVLLPGEVLQVRPSALSAGPSAEWGPVRLDVLRLSPGDVAEGSRLLLRAVWHTVVMVLEGGGAALEMPGGQRAELRPGRLDAIPAHHDLRGRILPPVNGTPAAGIRWLVLRVDPALNDAEPAWLAGMQPLSDLRDAALRIAMSTLRSELERPLHPNPELLAKAMGLMVMARLRESSRGVTRPRRADDAPLLSWRLRRAVAFAQENLGDARLTVDRIAAAAGLSTWHFARSFSASTGLSPHRWLLRARVERAQRLLRESELSLAEVALAVGLSSQSHLSVVFRRATGWSPGAFRARARMEADRAGEGETLS